MTTLYLLAANYQKCFDLLGQEEIDEQTVLDTIESLDGEINTKMKAVSGFFLNLEAQADAISEARKKMADRENLLRKQIEWYKTYLKNAMQANGFTEVSCPEFCIKLKKNPVKTVIDSMVAIPEIYKNAEVVYTPDKKAIKEALQAGENIPGAHLEQDYRLDIK